MKVYSVAEIINTQGVIIDVRSESEFAEAHIPTAVNVPLLNDRERAEIGTLYKKQGPIVARKRGLEIIQPKLEKLFDGIALAVTRGMKSPAIQIPKDRHWTETLRLVSEKILELDFEDGEPLVSPPDKEAAPPQITQAGEVGTKPILFCCWRGGARSKSMALIAHALGFNAGFIEGGHKAYRREALKFLEGELYPFKLCTLYGLTGSGKTKIIDQWQREGKPVIDLEALASHRGSAFGQVGIDKLGSQKDFENNLYWQIQNLLAKGEKTIVVEGESRRIGRCQLPERFIKAMLEGIHIQVVQPLEKRVGNILEEYFSSKDVERIHRENQGALDAIKKRLGPERHKELSALLAEKNYTLFTERLLLEYYDKTYALSRAPEEFYQATIGSAEEWDTISKLVE